MAHSNQDSRSDSRTVYVRGRRELYVAHRRIGQRDYFCLEHIGSPLRERYLAFCPQHGPGGDFFLLQTWPAGQLSQQHLRVLKRLQDDSFPRVWDWRRRDGQIDVVMSWIEGLSLEEYLQNIRAGRRPRVAPGHSVRLIHGLANAVCKLHHKLQIAHGDIQPANIIVTSHPSRLVLIDFGNAWTTDSAAFRVEGDGVNRFYAAPELQGQGTPFGFLTDQFSVSTIFYELLTHQLPYGGLGGKAGRPEYVGRAKESLLAPSQASVAHRRLPRSLRDSLDRVTMRGLALDPHQRYPDRTLWLKDLFETAARFRLAPELPLLERILTRVVERFTRPRRNQ